MREIIKIKKVESWSIFSDRERIGKVFFPMIKVELVLYKKLVIENIKPHKAPIIAKELLQILASRSSLCKISEPKAPIKKIIIRLIIFLSPYYF